MGMQLDFGGQISNASMDSLIPAVPKGLVYANVFGGVGINPGRNLVPGARPGIVVGKPDVADNFVGLGETAYIDTGIYDRDDLTVLLVGGVGGPLGAGKFGYFVGSYLPDSIGFNILMTPSDTSTTGIEAFIGRKPAGGSVVAEETGSLSSTSFNAALVRASSAYGTRFDGLTSGGFAEKRTAPIVPRSISPKTLLLGRAPFAQSGLYGSVNVALVMIWTRVLTDAEVSPAYQQGRALLLDQSIFV